MKILFIYKYIIFDKKIRVKKLNISNANLFDNYNQRKNTKLNHLKWTIALKKIKKELESKTP